MINEAEKLRIISVSDFKAHCTEQLRAVEEQGITLKITRHGKVVAIARPPKPAAAPGVLLGAGTSSAKINDSYDPHTPAFAEDDWECNEN